MLAGDRSIVGKNLDWSIGDGILSVNPRGLWKRALVDSTHRPCEWVSAYASVSFNQLGSGLPLGGMNEAGLVVEELAYWPSRYPVPDDRPAINELQWVQYQLDVHSSVAEVIHRASAVQVLPLLFGLHYFVADSSGDVAVIEFLDGELIIFTGSDLPVPVLTNDTYANSVRYLSLQEGYGGTRTAAAGPESPERFVGAATMMKEYESEQAEADPIAYAFQILRAVAQEDTQWSIVYDTESRTVRFRTAGVPGERRVSLAGLALDSGSPPLALNLADRFEGDIALRLSPWSRADQSRLIARVFEQLRGEGVVDDGEGRRLEKALVEMGGEDR